MENRSRGFWTMLALLAILGLFSVYLAMNRIYQVDECQNVFMARTIGTGQSASYFTNAPLWLIGPLAWLARSAKESTELFMWNRMIFLGVFWLNLYLMVLATGVRLWSRRGLFILLMAATLAPLWDYGFEIRHDNLLLTALLLTWWLGRTRPRGLVSYFLIGVLAVMMQFVAFKGFLYAFPLSAALLLFPPDGHHQSRRRLSAAWTGGALTAFLLGRLVYGLSGLWQTYLAGFQVGVAASGQADRFNPWLALQRPLLQAPLLLAITVAALYCLVEDLRRRSRSSLTWDNYAPEVFLFLGSVVIFLANPTPFPYNLLNIIPFAFLLSVRFFAHQAHLILKHPKTFILAGGILCFTHAIPFITATWRHVHWSNERQEKIIQTIESLTDPSKDRVFDGIGLVPTRGGIHFRWFLHSLVIQSFIEGKEPGVQEMLRANPPSLLVASYRTDWLRQQDWMFIRSHYLPLTDELWALGEVLPPGGGNFAVVHPGRYLLLGQVQGSISPLKDATLNGQTTREGPIQLGQGVQRLVCQSQIRPIFIWVGPKLDTLPILGPGSHQNLFVNWY